MPYPPKLTEDLISKLEGMVRAGIPPRTALRTEGINPGQGWQWLKNGAERPGSIYGAYRERMTKAMAEADAIDLKVIADAKTRGGRRITTVTKRQARDRNGESVMEVTEETETVVQLPPDANLALKMLGIRNPAFRETHQVDAQVGVIPKDVMARTIGERFRMLQGGEGPSLLREGDEEARALMEG